MELAGLNFEEEALEVVVVERQAARDHRVQDDAARPDVGLKAVVALARDDHRVAVMRRAARSLEERAGRVEACHAEVGDFEA